MPLPPFDIWGGQAAAGLQHEHNIEGSDAQVVTLYSANNRANKLWGGRSLFWRDECTVWSDGTAEGVQPLL
jgi:hypothetical protein